MANEALRRRAKEEKARRRLANQGRVTISPLAGIEQAQQEAEERGISLGELAAERGQQLLGVADDAARVAARGATLGWSDALAARAGSALSSEEYGPRLFLERARTEAASRRLGPAGTALEIGAAIPTGAAGYRLGTQALRQTSPLLRYTVPGAVEGGIAGAGYAEPGQRGAGAAIGAITGGTVGGALPLIKPVAGAVGRGVRGLYNRVRDPGGERTAATRVRQAAQRDELSGQEIAARVQRMGPEATLMDVSPSLLGLGSTLARTPGGAQARVQNTLSARQSRQGREALKSLRRNLQVGNREYSDELQGIIDRRATEADRFYTAARDDMAVLQRTETPTFTSDRVKNLIDNSADLGQAIKRAQRLPEFRGASPYSWDMVDRGYKYLNDRIRQLDRAGRSAQSRDLKRVRDDLRAAIVEENPTYQRALEAYAGDSALMDAIQAGRKFAKSEGEVTRETLERMSDLEKEMFRIGVVREARNMMQGGGTAWETNVVRRLFKNPEQVRTLEPIFPSRKDFLQFTREMIPLERQYRTYRRANPNIGSVTQPALSDEATSQLTDAARQWMRGDREGVASRAVDWARDIISPDTDDIRRATARLLMPRTPEELQRSLDVIANVKKPTIRQRLAAEVMANANRAFGTVEAAAPALSAIAAEERLNE